MMNDDDFNFTKKWMIFEEWLDFFFLCWRWFCFCVFKVKVMVSAAVFQADRGIDILDGTLHVYNTIILK